MLWLRKRLSIISDVLEQENPVNYGVHRALALLFGFALTTHIFACGWYALAEKEAIQDRLRAETMVCSPGTVTVHYAREHDASESFSSISDHGIGLLSRW